MPKFRSMKINTPDIATHLLDNPFCYVTSFGIFLRKFSLDELPQLWSILIGDMSFVGPRPALHNQDDLIKLRVKYNLHLLRPGLAGWAQVNGRDNLSLNEKVKLDKYYADNQSLWLDLKIIVMALVQIKNIKNVKH
jgi:O-antigen biosynthesis protein WbqP